MTTQEIKRELESYAEHGQICRLCMSDECLEDVLKVDHLTEWIWELLAIKISGDDRMSQVICTICRIRLTEFHQFRMGCHEVQEVLQPLIPGGTDEAQSANTSMQTDSKATNQLQQKGIVDDSLIRCEDYLLVFNDEKQLTNHKTIHNHENQKDIQVKSELVENIELELQDNDQSISFEKAEISSHIKDEEMENDQLGIEDCLVVEEVKIETPADDEVVASTESQHNKTKYEKMYRCDICQNVYSNIMQLKKHKNYHKWKLRQLENPEEKDSKYHLEVSDSSCNLKKKDCKDRIHQCDECPKTFLTRKVLIVHKKCVHGPKRHKCDICNVQFSMRFEMTRHIHTQKHMDKEQEIQKLVNEKTSNQNEKRHLATHASPAEHQQAKQVRDIASVPSGNGANENDKAHKNPSKSDENSSELPAGQPIQCDVCHEGFESAVHLYCHKKFFCRQEKNMHMKIDKPESTATKDFDSPKCHKICVSWKGLYLHVKDGHVRKKTLPKKRTVACPKCDKMFQTARQRDLHMRKVHICQICNKEFSERVQLWQHMYNQHGEKSTGSRDTTDVSDMEDSVPNSNEESTKPLEANATVE